mmetsp:Transcript_11763/g.14904  ORF Transcript_11763/g.14904 Transcript_11763/m.14904 type:complete len:144 (-) Transcript_11763:41-472(-)
MGAGATVAATVMVLVDYFPSLVELLAATAVAAVAAVALVLVIHAVEIAVFTSQRQGLRMIADVATVEATIDATTIDATMTNMATIVVVVNDVVDAGAPTTTIITDITVDAPTTTFIMAIDATSNTQLLISTSFLAESQTLAKR